MDTRIYSSLPDNFNFVTFFVFYNGQNVLQTACLAHAEKWRPLNKRRQRK